MSFLFLLLHAHVTAQKNEPPHFYDPGFKMPADTPVHTNGFYVFKTIYYDTLPTSNVKKDGYITIVRESETLYRFYDNGYFFWISADSGKKNIAERLQQDSSWVRKLYKMRVTDVWGFYILRNDSVLIETFGFEDNLRDITKTFAKQYFSRSQIAFRLKDKMLVATTRVIQGYGRQRFVIFPPVFFSSPYFVDPSNNKLLTNARFRNKTGFSPKDKPG